MRAIPSARAAWAADSPLERSLETSSADIVQAVQAIKEAHKRPGNLKALLLQLLEVLDECNDYCMEQGLSQPYIRTQLQVSDCLTMLYPAIYLNGHAKPKVSTITLDVDIGANWTSGQVDRVALGPRLRMPRMLNGFWQMSSPAWGSASGRKMDEALLDLASKGLVAADMADHYVSVRLIVRSRLTVGRRRTRVWILQKPITRRCPRSNHLRDQVVCLRLAGTGAHQGMGSRRSRGAVEAGGRDG